MIHRTRLPALVVAASGCFLGLLCAQGCAVGKSATGAAVLGFEVGISPDADALQAAGAGIGGALFGPGGAAAGGALATGLAAVFGLNRASAARRNAEREAAELRGANDGWTAREAAATVQAPLVGRVGDGGLPGPVVAGGTAPVSGGGT